MLAAVSAPCARKVPHICRHLFHARFRAIKRPFALLIVFAEALIGHHHPGHAATSAEIKMSTNSAVISAIPFSSSALTASLLWNAWENRLCSLLRSRDGAIYDRVELITE